jgi:drug/metabolite transporter (DMT)-like permease
MAVGALHGILVLVAAHTHALPPQRSIAAMRRPAALAARTSSPFMKQNAPAALRGGSAADGAVPPASDDEARPENTAGDTALTTLLLALWYASSIVNNQSSKVLVSLLGAEVLTLNQLLVSAGCGTLVLRQSPLRFDSRPHLILTAVLAASFLAGCYTLNSCLAAMHVSLAMVLRSAEPLTTLALGAVLLPAKEQPPLRKALALLPVVLGCALSALGPHAPSARALLLVAISNVCFSLRAILGRLG